MDALNALTQSAITGTVTEVAPATKSVSIPTVLDTLSGKCDLNEITMNIFFLKLSVVKDFIEIGMSLNEAKKIAEPGQWLKWLKDSVQISTQEAKRYMQVAEAYKNYAASVANLGVTKAHTLLSIPDNKREDFIDSPHEIKNKQKYVVDMSVQELKQVIKQETKPNNSDSTKSKMKPFTKDNMRKDFLSNLDTALKYLNKGVKFLEKNEGNTEIT